MRHALHSSHCAQCCVLHGTAACGRSSRHATLPASPGMKSSISWLQKVDADTSLDGLPEFGLSNVVGPKAAIDIVAFIVIRPILAPCVCSLFRRCASYRAQSWGFDRMRHAVAVQLLSQPNGCSTACASSATTADLTSGSNIESRAVAQSCTRSVRRSCRRTR